MAKEYKSKITLQDNFNSVISKAIKQTQILQKEFKKIEKLKANPKIEVHMDEKAMASAKKDLAKFEKNKVKIKAKLDSSFHSTMNTINRATAQNKTIKISAQETVTRTVKNLQRDIFTMERKLKTSILGGGRLSGGNISGNITTSSPDIISTLTGGFNRVQSGLNRVVKSSDRRTSSNNSRTRVTGDNSSFIEDAASNAVGTSAAMGAAGVTAAAMKRAMKANIVNVKGGKVNVDGDKLKPSFINAIKAGFKDAITKSKNRARGLIGDGEALQNADFGFRKSGRVYDGDSEFAKLIRGQKSQMASTRAKYGLPPKDYLSKYQQKTFTMPLGPDDDVNFTGMAKKANKAQAAVGRAFDKMKYHASIFRMYLNTKISDDAFNRLIRGTTRAKNAFSSLLNRITSFATKTRGKFTVVGQSLAHSIQRGAYHASASLGKLTMKFFGEGTKMRKAISLIGQSISVMKGKASFATTVFGRWTRPINAALRGVGKVGSNIGKIAAKAGRITMNIVGNALKTSAAILTNITKAAAVAAGGLVFKGVMDGATNEQYEVSMQHFIGNSIKDKNPKMNNKQVAKRAHFEMKKYMKNAVGLANRTPFSTQEVLEAANRGIGVAGGNTKQASGLLELSANMAALTPGKSVMDAMEALADLKMGERERMKEFGFKISNDDFVKAAGAKAGTNISDLTPEQMEKAYATMTDPKKGAVGKYFAGGADEISQTFKGQVSTLTGQIGSAFADVGRLISQPFVEPLKKVNDKLGEFANNISKFKEGVLSGEIPNPFVKWQEFIQWAGQNKENPIAKFALEIAPVVQTAISWIDMVRTAWASVSDSVKQSVDTMLIPIRDFFGCIGEKAPWVQGILNIMANVTAVVMDVFSVAFNTAYQVVKPILEWIGEHSEQINSILTFLGNIVKITCKIFGAAFKILWAILKPILSPLLDFLSWIADKMNKDYPAAAKAIDKFGDTVSKAISGVCNWFKNLTGKIGDAYNTLKDFLGLEDGLKGFSFSKIGYSKETLEKHGKGKSKSKSKGKSKNGRAVGQSYIPYNGYEASLHRGEAILTRQEADKWRAQRNNTHAEEEIPANITINVHGASDPNLVAKKIVNELRRVAPNM